MRNDTPNELPFAGKERVAALEALLFAAGEALELSRVAAALRCGVRDAAKLADALAAQLEERGSGLVLLRLEEKLQLCGKPQFASMARETLLIKRNAPLKQAALEALAVIAYRQPVTKSYVEHVRGVDCNATINALCEKGLLEEKGRAALPGRPILYGTTDVFLRTFGLRSLQDLPQIEEEQDLEKLIC
jgi:segregation and condensation protein B